jgi:hypothetical protein
MKKSELQQVIREEVKNSLTEIGNTSNAHPWVLRAMEELKDSLEYYLGPKNQYAGSAIDFDLLKKQMVELTKLIKKYHP